MREKAEQRSSGRGVVRRAEYDLRAHPVRFGALNGLIIHYLKTAKLMADKKMKQVFAGSNLTPAKFSVLALIANSGTVTQVELAEGMGVARSGIMIIINALESEGLIIKTIDAGDRRLQQVILSPSGRKAFESLSRKVIEADDILGTSLAAGERVQLLALLRKYTGETSGV